MQTDFANPLLGVLIVEDHESVRETLFDTLSDAGFDPVACGNGADALALAEQRSFAVAIVDQRLPDIEGTTLLEHLERVQPGIKLIIHTGYGSFVSAKEAINRGAFAYVEKLGEEDGLMLHVHRAARAWTADALQAAEVRHTRELEDRVRRRTEELVRKNETLSREITERKQAEEQLKKTQEYLDTILLNLPVGVAILEGPDFKFFRINQRLAEINGLSVEDHLDRPLAEVLPDAFPVIIPGLKHVLETGEPRLDREFSTRLPKDTDAIRHFIDSFFPIKGADGKPMAVGAVVVEITVRKQAEEMLKESEARYRQLVEQAHDVIYQVDTQGRFTYVNPVALRVGGYAEDEAIGRHFTHIIRKDYRHDALAFYERQMRERIESTYYEFPALTRDGSTLWIGQNVQLTLDGDQVLGFQAVARDISEQKRAEAQIQDLSKDLHQRAIALETANDQLARVSKYKSEFLATVSHELRTPLSSILLLSKILADNKEKTLTDEQVEAANIITSAGRNLATIIDDILDLSKVEAGKITLQPEKVSLLLLIENTKRQFELVAEKKSIEFRFEKKGRFPQYIATDVLRVGQILGNLLSNAFKFTESGSVTITVGKPGAGVEFSQPSLSRQRTVALSVMDTGIGIPEKKQQLIFEAFRQVDGSTTRRYGGTGLGLSISAGLAQLLGGELQVESEEGKGSTFTLYLPYEIETATSDDMVRVEASDSASPPGSSSDRELSLKPASTDPPAEFIPDDRADIEYGDRVVLMVEDDE